MFLNVGQDQEFGKNLYEKFVKFRCICSWQFDDFLCRYEVFTTLAFFKRIFEGG